MSETFEPLAIFVITISDTRREADDRSGALLVERLEGAGHRLAGRAIVRDEVDAIEAELRRAVTDPAVDVVLATGGTGVTGRDVTPEAFERVLEKRLPGFGERFRRISEEKIGSAALLSRACAGIAGRTLLFALPGSPGGCADAWDAILAEQLDTRTRPCSLAALLPRLKEG